MAFGTEAFSSDVADSRRARVSDVVEDGDADRTAIKASIAATGFVMRGSSARISL